MCDRILNRKKAEKPSATTTANVRVRDRILARIGGRMDDAVPDASACGRSTVPVISLSSRPPPDSDLSKFRKRNLSIWSYTRYGYGTMQVGNCPRTYEQFWPARAQSTQKHAATEDREHEKHPHEPSKDDEKSEAPMKKTQWGAARSRPW
jgi:hypothetical protein